MTMFEFAATECCRRKIPRLDLGRSLPLEGRLDRLAEWLDSLYANEAFNGSVLIAERGHVRFERHYGFADLEGTVPLTGRSSYSLASVSKAFTAMGVMLLAHQGKQTRDDRLVGHIPEFSLYPDVTIRQLLHHTSGVPDYMELADRHWEAGRVLTMADLIALFDRHRPERYFPPGDLFEYSNTGYALLGEIIARASGATYPEFMSREIFRPLGMNDSAAFNLASKECPLPRRVFGARRTFNCLGKKVPCDLNHLDGVFGDGGIYSSAQDLVRWDAALREGAIIPCNAYAEAYVSGRIRGGRETGYGFGWEIKPGKVVDHWGEWQGFSAYVRRDLKDDLLLVLLSNLGPPICVDAISADLCKCVESV